MNNKVKKALTSVSKFGLTAAGVAAGSVLMKKIPAFGGPAILQKVAPGLIAMAGAIVIDATVDNENVKGLAAGIGIAGFIDVVKKTIAPKVPVIDQALPSLSGRMGYVQNYGAYDPSYFTTAGAAQLQGGGMGANAYQLMGMGANAYQLMGPSEASPYLLN